MIRRLTLALALVLAAVETTAEATDRRSAPATFAPADCSSAPFDDVPQNHPYCAWIRQLDLDGVSTGCGAPNKYCPENPVTRGQVAMLLEKAMRGTASWEPGQGLYKRTRIVSPVPGDSAASGAALLVAVAGITDAAADNTYLVKLEPGTYDVGSSSVALPDYVDLEGSGAYVTKIAGDGSGPPGIYPSRAVLEGGFEARNLTVAATGNTGINAAVVATYSLDGVRVEVAGTATNVGVYQVSRLRETTIDASGGTAVWNVGGAWLRGVEASGSVAIRNEYGNVELREVVAKATAAAGYAVFNSFANVRVDHSDLEGKLYGDGFLVGASRVAGTKENVSSIACVGAWEANYLPLGPECDCGPYLNERDTPGEADYCVLQFPAALHAVNGVVVEGQAYGRVYEAGLTEPAGAASAVHAQLGWGPLGSDPRSNCAWRWFDAPFNLQVGNDDEYGRTFAGAELPAANGNYSFAYRFSVDNGARWTVCDTDGAGSNPGHDFATSALGTLSVQ